MLFVMLFILTLGSPAGALSQGSLRDGAEVRGVVTDINSARMRGVALFFRGKDGTRDAVTTEAGTYVLQLPPGVYTVEVRDNRGSCPITRGPLTLPRARTVQLNFTLYVCPIVDVYEAGHASTPTGRPPQPSLPDASTGIYQLEEYPAGSRGLPYRLQVWFAHRHKQGGIVVYGGLSPRTPVRLAYNLLTVRANRVLYDRSRRTITACGEVTYEDGYTVNSAAAVRFRVQGAAPKVTMLDDESACGDGPA